MAVEPWCHVLLAARSSLCSTSAGSKPGRGLAVGIHKLTDLFTLCLDEPFVALLRSDTVFKMARKLNRDSHLTQVEPEMFGSIPLLVAQNGADN